MNDMSPNIAYTYFLEGIAKLECGGEGWLLLSATQAELHGTQT